MNYEEMCELRGKLGELLMACNNLHYLITQLDAEIHAKQQKIRKLMKEGLK